MAACFLVQNFCSRKKESGALFGSDGTARPLEMIISLI